MNTAASGDTSKGMKGSKTTIKIADVETGNVIVVLRGHFDLIHDLDWS
jgi:hypothetical protein